MIAREPCNENSSKLVLVYGGHNVADQIDISCVSGLPYTTPISETTKTIFMKIGCK